MRSPLQVHPSDLPPAGFDVSSVESAFASSLLAITCADCIARGPTLPSGATFEIVAYSSSREGIDRWMGMVAHCFMQGGIVILLR